MNTDLYTLDVSMILDVSSERINIQGISNQLQQHDESDNNISHIVLMITLLYSLRESSNMSRT